MSIENDNEQAHLPREEIVKFKEYLMNTVGWARYMERRRVGMCACTLISCYCYYGYREILK